jgi:hypothetical protein
MNRIGIAVGLCFGILGTFTYYFLAYRTIKSIKIHKWKNLIEI